MRRLKSISSLRSERFAKNVKIAFDKVSSSPKPFSLADQGLTLAGLLHKSADHRVELDAKLTGTVTMDCDRCSVSYDQKVDEPVKLQLSDRIVQDKEDLDIIEFLDGMIDLMYVLKSETNALTSDYHFCAACAQNDGTLEIEF